MATMVGPVSVDAQCAVKATGSLSFEVACAAKVKSMDYRTVYLCVSLVGAPSNTQLVGVNRQIRLIPGGEVTLKAPPVPGSRWQVVIITQSELHRAAEAGGLIGYAILGLAAYGGYSLVRDYQAKHRGYR